MKEAKRGKLESGTMHRHHRPILSSGNVMHPYRVPEHHVGVLDRAVGLSPCRKSCSTSMLVRIVSGRVTLRRVIRSGPQVFGSEGSTLEHTGLWMCEGQNVFAGYELVGYRLTEAIVY